MTKITTGDLIYIGEAAKALKQGAFVFINNTLIGLDNIDNYITYVRLGYEYLSDIFSNGMIINARELSKFLKSVISESEFEIDENAPCSFITTSADTLRIDNNQITINNALSRIRQTRRYDNMMVNEDIDITNRLEPLLSMKKTNGIFKYIHDSDHYMTLFPGLLPVTKSDTVGLNIFDIHDGTFVTRYTVDKKKFKVFVYIRYLKI